MTTYNTLKYYEERAEEYCSQTQNWDVANLYTLFEKYLPNHAYILDFGCGSGRDSKHFLEKGYHVHATDGSTALCKLASNYIGQEVDHLLFEQLDEENIYDGIWACSSILHVERQKLPDIFTRMLRALKPDGIIYTSFKVGAGEKIKEGKLYTEFTPDNLAQLLQRLPIQSKIIEYISNTSHKRSRPGFNQWGNYIIQKSPVVL